MSKQQADGIVTVVGVDFSEGSAEAVQSALRLAGASPGTTLHAVHVVPESEGWAKHHLEENATTLDRVPPRLREFVAKQGGAVGGTQQQWPDRVWVHVRIGAPVDAIHQLAIDVDADLNRDRSPPERPQQAPQHRHDRRTAPGGGPLPRARGPAQELRGARPVAAHRATVP